MLYPTHVGSGFFNFEMQKGKDLYCDLGFGVLSQWDDIGMLH